MESSTAALPALRLQSDKIYSYFLTPITPVEHHGTFLRFRARLRRKDGTSRVHDVMVENMVNFPDLVEWVWHALEQGNCRVLASFQRAVTRDPVNARIQRINVVAHIEGFPKRTHLTANHAVQLNLPF